jgi:hypothetical protein
MPEQLSHNPNATVAELLKFRENFNLREHLGVFGRAKPNQPENPPKESPQPPVITRDVADKIGEAWARLRGYPEKIAGLEAEVVKLTADLVAVVKDYEAVKAELAAMKAPKEEAK